MAISKIENIYLHPADIHYPKSREVIASKWEVTFTDGRILLYTITILKGSLKNEYFPNQLYIQIDDWSTPREEIRDIQILSRRKKIHLKKSTIKEYYKIASTPFDNFKNEEELSFDKINKEKWIKILKNYLLNHIKINNETVSEKVPLLADENSDRENGSNKFSVNGQGKGSGKNFLKLIFPCCFK